MDFVDHFIKYYLMYIISYILNDSLFIALKNEHNNIEGNSIEFNFK